MLAALTSTVPAHAAASAPIGFDRLPDGTVPADGQSIGQELRSQGLYFLPGGFREAGFPASVPRLGRDTPVTCGGLPATVATALATSAPRALAPSECITPMASARDILAVLTTTRSSVSVRIGPKSKVLYQPPKPTGPGGPGPFREVVTPWDAKLVAYNANHVEIARSEVHLAESYDVPPGLQYTLSVDRPVADIKYVYIRGPYATDVPPPPPPKAATRTAGLSSAAALHAPRGAPDPSKYDYLVDDILLDGEPAAQPSPIDVKYGSLGGLGSYLGAALGPESDTVGGRYRDYRGGSIYYSRTTGAHALVGQIRSRWLALGGAGGFLGHPRTDELPAGVDGRFDEFAGGAIFWSPRTGAHEVHGRIKERWYALGAVNGSTGFPISDELVASDRVGRHSEFEHASIYWSPRTGAHAVRGAVRRAWAHDLRRWGYPLTDEIATHYGAAGAYDNFQKGTIHWSSRNGIQTSARCPRWACKDGRARTRCDAQTTLGTFRTHKYERLSAFERQTGEIGTLLKRTRILAKGWASKACFVHNAIGRVIRSPQWSTDDIWTLDVRLEDFRFEELRITPKTPPLFIRLEVEPHNGHTVGYAHRELDRRGPTGKKLACIAGLPPTCKRLPKKLLRGSALPPGTVVRFGGLVVLDSDHGFLEVHPDKEFSIG